MKDLLRYKFALLKKKRIPFVLLSFLALLGLFCYYLTRRPLDDLYRLSMPFPLIGHIFSSSFHHLAVTFLPPFSFILGLVLGFDFLSGDFANGRLKMMLTAKRGKRWFFEKGSLTASMIGMAVIFSLWLILSFASAPIWRVKALEGNVFSSLVEALISSFLLFLVSLFLFSSLGILIKDAVFSLTIGVILFALTYAFALSSSSSKIEMIDKAVAVFFIPFGGFAILSWFGDSWCFWVASLVSFISIILLRKAGLSIYERKEI